MSHQPNNIFAGTQVVALLEVRGPNNSLVHPRGAVGVVTRTPAVTGEKYLVRFPDGFEASFESAQLEVLKHFKDRLGEVGRVTPCAPGLADGSQGTASPTFDLEQFIIYRCVVGSRVYGLDNDDSDTDRRGIYLAPADLQWSLFGAPEQFEDNATQSCYWELQKFLTMALKANPNILECLYSPIVEKVTPLGEELLAIRDAFLSQMIFQTFNGYAMSQFKKMEQDLRNHGEVRVKHANRYPACTRFLNEMEAVVAEPGRWRSLSGRIRHFNLGDAELRMDSLEEGVPHLLRQARNFPEQELVAATTGRALLRFIEERRRLGLRARIGVLLYDAMTAFAPLEEARHSAELLRNCLTVWNQWDAPGGRFHFEVDTNFYFRWGVKMTQEERVLLDRHLGKT